MGVWIELNIQKLKEPYNKLNSCMLASWMFVGGVTLQVYGIAFVPLKMLGFQPSMALNLLVTTRSIERDVQILRIV